MYKYYLSSERQEEMDRYILQQEAFGLPKGTIFVHDKEDNIVGSIAAGCLKLAWDNGNCQEKAPCGGTYILHASAKDNPNWFKKEVSIKEEMKRKIIEFVQSL